MGEKEPARGGKRPSFACVKSLVNCLLRWNCDKANTEQCSRDVGQHCQWHSLTLRKDVGPRDAQSRVFLLVERLDSAHFNFGLFALQLSLICTFMAGWRHPPPEIFGAMHSVSTVV